ncbi:MAG: hypothetical protein K5843_01675 [Bacteroidales bacterium]|nr:hypothetical protein [Bacteroidales bacterium]
MIATIPARLRLDNAANIYPASMSKHYSSLYRMKVSLVDPVDTDILQAALLRVSERIPTFRCTLRNGTFWWYLDRCKALPCIRPVKPLKHFSFKEQEGLLYRVSVEGKEILLDVFHALADGNGAMCFLLTLAGEYIRTRYGVSLTYNQLVWNPGEHPVYAEVEDSFKTVFSGRHGQLEKNVDAYHIRGNVLPFSAVKDLRAVLSADAFRRVCRQYGCTVTELLTATMLWALQEEHRIDTSARKRSVLKVSVPVNLRPIYGSRTVRNFSSYVNLGVDVKDGYYSFPELVAAVKAQKEHDLHKENLEPKIAANVELEEMLLVRMLPLKIKHPIIDIINLLHGDRFCSQTLSNMGNLEVPEEMRIYMTGVDFILGRQRGNSGAFSCVSYNGKMYLHMTRKVAGDRFEMAFLRQLSALGLSVSTQLTNLA